MTQATKILLVEDDPALCRSLAEQLRLHEEFLVSEAETGAAALEAVRSAHFHAVILDIGLPDMDGREVCRLMRRSGVKAPVLMLTGHGTDADQVLGLDAGASDYIVKPFRLNVLLARLRAQVRQHENSEDAEIAVGPYTFRPAVKLLKETATGRRIRLTEKETALLRYLYRVRDRVVDSTVLLDEVWGYHAEAASHTLQTHVYRLRQKIEPDPGTPAILVTEQGGYRLVP